MTTKKQLLEMLSTLSDAAIVEFHVNGSYIPLDVLCLKCLSPSYYICILADADKSIYDV